MGKKNKPLAQCKTSDDFFNKANQYDGRKVNGGSHVGVEDAEGTVFIPIPVHGHRSEPLKPGTASSIRRSYKELGWLLIPLLGGGGAGILMFLAGG